MLSVKVSQTTDPGRKIKAISRLPDFLQLIQSHLGDINGIEIDVGLKFNPSEYFKYLLPDWIPAIEPEFIVKTPEDKELRANQILNMILPDLKGKKFLDYGNEIYAKMADLSMGFNQNWQEVKCNGPFDVILIYDKLDHMKDEEEVISELRKIREVLSGSLYIRFHPWCSRHACHIYDKAFLHLVFSEEELANMGYEVKHTIKTKNPLATYERWLKDFKIVDMQIRKDIVESFFTKSILADTLKKQVGDMSFLEYSFIDYVVT